MSSSSPEPGVLRGDRAGTLTTARFATDLRTQANVAPEVSAQLRAVALAPAGRPVTVRLSPADRATLDLDESTVDIDGRAVTILADAGLRPGDAVAECDATTIDARLDTALARAKEVLGL